MKKVSFIIAAAFVMLLAGNAQAQLGVNIGYAPQTTTVASGSNSSSSDMNGFFAGVNYNHVLSGNIGVSFGGQIRYNTKTTSSTILSATSTTKQTQLLVDVPVLFNFAIPMGSDARIALFVGPVFSYALKGNTNISENVLNTNTNVDWYGENSNNNQFDLMGAAGAALEFKTFRLFGGYRMGFADLDKREKVKTTTSGIFVGVGYML
ncbi:MAG: outer membrane beta-barrel protein [Bacteroidales bacterium]|nr:outer membrane beta-barrel protein [Bacteroidales bacterium]